MNNEKKKKVYISNFWHGINYGASLTAYALFKLLSDLNYDPYFIDNRILISFIKEKIFYTEKFIKQYFKYQKFKGEEDAILITGSDQVFNPNCIALVHDDNLLNFGGINNKKISISASFGVDKDKFLEQNSPETIERMKTSLKSFDFISVRETSGIEICNEVFGVNAVRIADPVFIIDKGEWEKFAEKRDGNFSKKLNTHKIVSYIFGKTKEHEEAYKYLSKKYNTEVLDMTDFKNPPENWLFAIKNCDLFITNSFHGLCFAILFHKPFICLIKEKESSARFDSIFNTLGIENQSILLKEIYEKDCVFKVDYEKTDRIIEEEKQRGKEFLLRSLTSDPEISEERNQAKSTVHENYMNKLKSQNNLGYKIHNVLFNIKLVLFSTLLPRRVVSAINFLMRLIKKVLTTIFKTGKSTQDV